MGCVVLSCGIPELKVILLSAKVGAKDAVSVYFWVVPENLGQVPIEVRALSNAAADAVRRQLLVKVLTLYALHLLISVYFLCPKKCVLGFLLLFKGA